MFILAFRAGCRRDAARARSRRSCLP
jgi:hypothetical protein